jgi:REP element-mobilizing transposase RayT
MDKFQNKYRIPSARLQSWDYGANGAYFITICSGHREHYFGEIVKIHVPTMQLNEIGKLAEQFWMEIPNHFPFIELGNFVVMPNHVHGILIINKNGNGMAGMTGSEGLAGLAGLGVETPKLGVSNANANANAYNANRTAAATKKWKPNTIGSIVNQYKRICTINARKINAGFEWQSRFWDHIIRDSAEFERIQDYIADNPLKWKEDKFYGKST